MKFNSIGHGKNGLNKNIHGFIALKVDLLRHMSDNALCNTNVGTSCMFIGETAVSWHVFQKNAHKTQESLISGMSDVSWGDLSSDTCF